MSEIDYLSAVNSRCNISGNGKCVDCKAVTESVKYINQLQAENKRLKEALEKVNKNSYTGLAVDQGKLLNRIYYISGQALKEKTP